MPSRSKVQQRAAGMAYAAKKGKTPKKSLKGAAKRMIEMDESDLLKYAKTKRKGLPNRKKKK